jgi:predicted transcriptional regulator
MSTQELNTTTHGSSTATRERALVLLGQGISVDATAAACGVSAAAISQLLSMDDFAAAVAERRFHALEKHNKQDSEYDEIENTLTAKFKESIPLMMKPMEILKGLQVINAQKRRGASAPESIHDKQTVVSISLPAIILNNFANTAVETNIHNQVVKIGDKDLTTMQSGTLLNIHKNTATLTATPTQKELTHVSPTPTQPQPPKLARTKRDPTDI